MELPADFVRDTRSLLGDEACGLLEKALQEEQTPVSLRLNEAKCTPYKAEELLPAPVSGRVAWCSTGYYLKERPSFTADPLFHAGCYYVQEAASMFVEQAVRTYVQDPAKVLDLCAAPGGKATLLRSLLPEGSLLVANEPVRSRTQVLAENLTKWGHPGVVVTRCEPAAFAALPSFFDAVLADVPCSGEGMFRKDTGTIGEWSRENVMRCRERQRTILSDMWETLKPGGVLIYSTCTYNLRENEENVAWMQEQWGAEVLPLPVEAAWGITGNLSGATFPVYRFLPHRTRGEGFFLAVLRKAEGEKETSRRKKRAARNEKGAVGSRSSAVPAACRQWLLRPDAFQWEVREGRITAFPQCHREAYRQLTEHLPVVQAGLTAGEQKGKSFQPAHALAMSVELNRDAFPAVPLSRDQAVAYLRRESLPAEGNLPDGYVLLTYRSVPLGFAKHVGNRLNNLYPAEWRIRSSYL